MDKTELSRNERLRRARELSHDMRTPITSILGFAELLLEETSIQGTSREYLTIIAKESAILAEMLTEFLGLVELEYPNAEKTEQ